MAKVAAPGNDVSWAMQFEEEWFTRLECAKLSVAGRLPKIHFVSLLGAEIAEPIVIGHSDEEAHRQDYSSRIPAHFHGLKSQIDFRSLLAYYY